MTLNCAGTLFYTTTATLRLTSSYFASMLNAAGRRAPAEIFLDRAAAAFKVLLSCMRNHTVLLPQSDADLFARVMLEADFFGVDWLVREVKAKAVQNSKRRSIRMGFVISTVITSTPCCTTKSRRLSKRIARQSFSRRKSTLISALAVLQRRCRTAFSGSLLSERSCEERAPATIKHLLCRHRRDTAVAFSRRST